MIGQTISHYKIIEKLGEGGMGIVYKAEDTKLRRFVALKFLPRELTGDTAAKERFIHEAQAASALDHPNICTIHEVGETENGQLFICMSFCEGETLKTKIGKSRLEFAEIINLSIQIARGLMDAHHHGIVHRDIKPANIMITNEGVVKIVDFGLAKLINATNITQTGATLGTVAYMSPEQLQGEKVDERSDIWSFGIILYEILTGRTPFKGEHPFAMSYSIVNENPESISRYRKGIPKKLEILVNQCLRKNKNQRPQTANDIIKILEGKRLKIHLRLPKRIVIFTSIFLIISVVIAYLIYKPPDYKLTDGKEIGIAVLKFTIASNDTAICLWPGSLQILIREGLTGIHRITVFDPGSLDGLLQNTFGSTSPPPPAKLYKTLNDIGVTMLVGGKIMKVSSEFMLYVDLINPQNAQVIYSTRKSLKVEDELPQTADNITREILDYLNIQSNSRIASDLEPWRQGTGSIEAVKAFEMASRHTYRVERGGEEYLRQAIGFDSSFISPRIWLIATLAQTGRYDEARQHYEVLLRLKPRANSFDKAMIEWCDGYLGKDKIHQAQALERALEYSRSNNILLANLADIRYGLGDYQSALDALLPIVKMRWNYGPVYSLAGKCYLKLGKYKEARQLLEGSLGIPKPAGDTYALLAALYLRNGDTSKADEYTSKALRIYNESPYAWEEVNEYIGIDFLAVKCWNEAIEYFRKVLHRNPRSASTHQNLANALYGMGNRETALAEYQQALQLDSTLGDVHYSIGKICDEQGKIQAAINHYRLFLKYDSISINALNAKKREQGLTSIIQISKKQQH